MNLHPIQLNLMQPLGSKAGQVVRSAPLFLAAETHECLGRETHRPSAPFWCRSMAPARDYSTALTWLPSVETRSARGRITWRLDYVILHELARANRRQLRSRAAHPTPGRQDKAIVDIGSRDDRYIAKDPDYLRRTYAYVHGPPKLFRDEPEVVVTAADQTTRQHPCTICRSCWTPAIRSSLDRRARCRGSRVREIGTPGGPRSCGARFRRSSRLVSTALSRSASELGHPMSLGSQVWRSAAGSTAPLRPAAGRRCCSPARHR